MKPRFGLPGHPDDSLVWQTVAPAVDQDNDRSTTNGVDILYGGWGADALQADDSPRRQPGDRLIDWVGSFNVYYVCDGGYGAPTVIRAHSPAMVEFLELMAINDGAQ